MSILLESIQSLVDASLSSSVGRQVSDSCLVNILDQTTLIFSAHLLEKSIIEPIINPCTTIDFYLQDIFHTPIPEGDTSLYEFSLSVYLEGSYTHSYSHMLTLLALIYGYLVV